MIGSATIIVSRGNDQLSYTYPDGLSGVAAFWYSNITTLEQIYPKATSVYKRVRYRLLSIPTWTPLAYNRQ